jgi:GGDEF domain-containing protein
MFSDLRLRRRVVSSSLVGFAMVFGLSVFFDRPGLGVAHGFYIPIGLAAMAAGPIGGVAAGLLATLLYAVGVVINPHIPPSDVPTVATAIRMISFVSVGAMIGHFAAANRRLMGGALDLVEEWKVLAKRDAITRLPNTRAFEDAIKRRLGEGSPFLLLVGDPVNVPAADTARSLEDATEWLRDVAMQLTALAGRAHEVARIGHSQFAVLAPLAPHRGTGQLAETFERRLEAEGARMTFGWASFPKDGGDALALFRVADERLYARKIVRGEWEPSAASAGLVQQLPVRRRAV